MANKQYSSKATVEVAGIVTMTNGQSKIDLLVSDVDKPVEIPKGDLNKVVDKVQVTMTVKKSEEVTKNSVYSEVINMFHNKQDTVSKKIETKNNKPIELDYAISKDELDLLENKPVQNKLTKLLAENTVIIACSAFIIGIILAYLGWG